MHTENLNFWQHAHTFGQEKQKKAEKSTLIVIGITALTMVVEIVAGIIFGSMALLADGLHMGSHTLALGISAFAYYYTREHAKDPTFSFGTGKVNSLGGFSSAILLGIFAFFMVWESIERFFDPVEILFDQAIGVAVIGLVVNVVSMWLLSGSRHADHHHHTHSHDHHDHNLKAAYFHVFADALTSLFAIFALLAGKFFGFIWMDPFMGIVGAFMITRWSLGLIRETSRVLLDKQASEEIQNAIQRVIENDSTDRISDLHVWSIGSGIYAVNLALVSDLPKSPEYYKDRLPNDMGIAHVTVEVHTCTERQG